MSATWLPDGSAVVDDASENGGAADRTVVDLAAVIAEVSPVAVGGGRLYTYREGVYVPGDRILPQLAFNLLGGRWSKRRGDEVLAAVGLQAPELWERPPLAQINLRNGLLDVRTRTLHEPSPGFLSPVQLGASYDPEAECPAFEAYLAATAPDLREMLLELLGLLLVPDNSYQRAFMLLGEGGTGKSTFLNLLKALLGAPNVSTVALHELDEDRWARADLYGKLANTSPDLPSQALRGSSSFKAITGGTRSGPSASTPRRSSSPRTRGWCSLRTNRRRRRTTAGLTSIAGRSCRSSGGIAARPTRTAICSRS